MLDFSFDPSKAIFALVFLICALIVHMHISHRTGNSITTINIGRWRWLSRIRRPNIAGRRSNYETEKVTYGDRVVFGEVFAIVAAIFSVFFLFDSAVDIFPEYDTKDIVTDFFVDRTEISAKNYEIVKNILPYFLMACLMGFNLIFAIVFYIFNSDRITDDSKAERQLRSRASVRPKPSTAPIQNAETDMHVIRADKTNVPTIEEIRRDLSDPKFVAELLRVGGQKPQKLSEADVEEAILFDEFLKKRNK